MTTRTRHWEYKRFISSSHDMDSELFNLGTDGWELCGVTTHPDRDETDLEREELATRFRAALSLAVTADAPRGPWEDFDDLNPHVDGMTVGVTTRVIGGLNRGRSGKIVAVDYGTRKAQLELHPDAPQPDNVSQGSTVQPKAKFFADSLRQHCLAPGKAQPPHTCGCTICHSAKLLESWGSARPEQAGVPEGPSDDAKLAFIKAHTTIMHEWEVSDGWEEALDAGLRAAYEVDRLHAQEER